MGDLKKEEPNWFIEHKTSVYYPTCYLHGEMNIFFPEGPAYNVTCFLMKHIWHVQCSIYHVFSRREHCGEQGSVQGWQSG